MEVKPPAAAARDPANADTADIRRKVERGDLELQRRLRIGYGRAAHLIDMMYNDGLVGPADGSKPREILKSPNWISEVDAAIR